MQRRLGENNAAIILACFVLSFSCPNQMASPQPSTSSVQSKRVSRILKEAQVGERPIRITEFEGAAGSPYSGTVDFDDPNEIKVSINRNLPPRTAENNLVHELYHIILFKQGFRYRAGSFKFNEAGDVGRLYTAVAKALTSCYVDPLIDRHMSGRGFEPYLVTQLTADGLASIQSSDVLKSSQLPHWVDYAAMRTLLPVFADWQIQNSGSRKVVLGEPRDHREGI